MVGIVIVPYCWVTACSMARKASVLMLVPPGGRCSPSRLANVTSTAGSFTTCLSVLSSTSGFSSGSNRTSSVAFASEGTTLYRNPPSTIVGDTDVRSSAAYSDLASVLMLVPPGGRCSPSRLANVTSTAGSFTTCLSVLSSTSGFSSGSNRTSSVAFASEGTTLYRNPPSTIVGDTDVRSSAAY